MKKLLALALAAMMLASIGCAWAEGTTEETVEITFQGIPWGSSAEEVKEWIKKSSFLKEPIVLESTDLGSVFFSQYLTEDGEHDYLQSGLETAKVLRFESSIHPDFKMAGYNLYSVHFVFAYNGDVSKLIAVDIGIECINGAEATFTDLKQKLCTVYGAGNKDSDDTYLKLGKNNTAVRLEYYASYFGAGCDLIYGDTNARAVLEEMTISMPQNAVDSTDVSGL